MKSYTTLCSICGTEFIAQRSDADTCGPTCRKKKSRKKKEYKIWELGKRNAQNEQRITTLIKQVSILEKKNRELTELTTWNDELKTTASTEAFIEKKITQTVNYEELDVWILLARMLKLGYESPPRDLLPHLSFRTSHEEIVRDFETRFHCSVENAKDAFPMVQEGNNQAENSKIVEQYGKLEYSI